MSGTTFEWMALHEVTDTYTSIRKQHSTQWEYQLSKTVQNVGTQPISEILHIEIWIVCCKEIYLILF